MLKYLDQVEKTSKMGLEINKNVNIHDRVTEVLQ
jgi:hypothetical protein